MTKFVALLLLAALAAPISQAAPRPPDTAARGRAVCRQGSAERSLAAARQAGNRHVQPPPVGRRDPGLRRERPHFRPGRSGTRILPGRAGCPPPAEEIDVLFAGGAHQWSLAAADSAADMRARRGSYRVLIPWREARAEAADQVTPSEPRAYRVCTAWSAAGRAARASSWRNGRSGPRRRLPRSPWMPLPPALRGATCCSSARRAL